MTHLAAIAAVSLLTAAWQGAILATAVALCLRLLPGLSAAVRSAIWTTVFALLLALHFVPAPTAAATAAHTVHAAPIWSLALAGLWLTLSLFRAIQFALSAWRLHQVTRRATPIVSYADTTNDGRDYTLCISPDVDRPSVLGFWRPRILLPPGLLEALTPAELHQVLLHETEHLRRSDDWTNLFQKLALVIFPLNPALLWVERRLCLERELACDDRVLTTTGARKAYATCLTQIAEHGMLRRGLSLALAAWSRQSELTHRVRRILRRPTPLLSPARTRFATAALLFGVLAASLTLARTPSLISFAQPATTTASAAPEPWITPTAKVINARMVTPGAAVAPFHAAKAVIRRAAKPRTLKFSQDRQPEPETGYRTMTITYHYEQVQPVYVPAIARVPAYAAVRTPDGWILIQL